eukprot:COSAG04_NODE_7387_length_1136_cov_0.998071_1_plen_136_part_10
MRTWSASLSMAISASSSFTFTLPFSSFPSFAPAVAVARRGGWRLCALPLRRPPVRGVPAGTRPSASLGSRAQVAQIAAEAPAIALVDHKGGPPLGRRLARVVLEEGDPGQQPAPPVPRDAPQQLPLFRRRVRRRHD